MLSHAFLMVNLLLLLPILKQGLACWLCPSFRQRAPSFAKRPLRVVIQLHTSLSLGYLRLRQIQRRSDGRWNSPPTRSSSCLTWKLSTRLAINHHAEDLNPSYRMRRARGIARRSRSARGKKGVKRIHDSKLLLSGQEERIYRVQRKVFWSHWKRLSIPT